MVWVNLIILINWFELVIFCKFFICVVCLFNEGRYNDVIIVFMGLYGIMIVDILDVCIGVMLGFFFFLKKG